MNLFNFIKQRIPILDVIGEYATLKKAGLYWKGCCPLHFEKTPSFSVSPHKEIFYCFGCHAGGDVISFITKIEHCTPLEAAQHLVERYQIALPVEVEWHKGQDSHEAKGMYTKTCLVFAHWCAHQLTQHQAAQAYLEERAITPESISTFMLGYCSSDIKGLLARGQKEGVFATNFIDAHILLEGKQGLYSPFEDRIIFPIRDTIGKYVGFGGRVFKKNDDRPKYYNSHDHAFFNKGSLLFGLDHAKKKISEKNDVFLVEGYTDLIIMNQHGFTNTVATLGTACTQEHLKILSRYAQRLSIVYDGDQAGHNAILRLVELCWQVALDPYVLALPSGEDPALFLTRGGDLTGVHADAQDIFSFVIQTTGSAFSQKSLQERIAIAHKVLSIIRLLTDPFKQDLLLKQASDTFALPFDTLKDELRKGNAKEAQKLKRPSAAEESAERNPSLAAAVEISQLEKKLFYGILYRTELLKEQDQDLLRLWAPKPLQGILESIITLQSDQELSLDALFEKCTSEEKELVSRIIIESEEECATPLQDLLVQFYKKQWKLTIHNVKLKIYDAQERGDGATVTQLLDNLTLLKKKMLGRDIV
ncbi:DNA primase [Candidatus Dependentiae bacterium]|nr:DNA primase [Candidatus Dependentiae bacterium]